MSTRTLGILASLVGSAIGAWWMMNQRQQRLARTRRRDRGTVIFDNTPAPADTAPIV